MWAAQGPFSSGEESSAAFQKAISAMNLDLRGIKSSGGIDSRQVYELHSKPVGENPADWEKVRRE